MFLNLETITPAAAEPVTLDRAKRHLRVGFADDDLDITALISVARQSAENWLGRPIRAASYRATFDYWATPFVIDGQGPVQVTAVDYLNAASLRATVPATDYQSGHGTQGQIVCPVTAWPAGAAVPMPRVAFNVGFSEVPFVIQHAILLGVQFLYDNRGTMVLSSQDYKDSQAWQNLLWPYRIVSL